MSASRDGGLLDLAANVGGWDERVSNGGGRSMAMCGGLRAFKGLKFDMPGQVQPGPITISISRRGLFSHLSFFLLSGCLSLVDV